MTRCEACQSRDAVIHITKILGATTEISHLCEQCAAERGITSELGVATMPSGSLFPELDSGSPADREMLHCPTCGATLADIEATKRVGCARCWSIFEAPLRDLVQRMQGSTRHVGKVYSGERDTTDSPEFLAAYERARLHQALQSAIAEERFEDAAVLRDQLRTLEA